MKMDEPRRALAQPQLLAICAVHPAFIYFLFLSPAAVIKFTDIKICYGCPSGN